MKFKLKALIVVSIILVSSLILYYKYGLVNKPKFNLEKSAEYVNEFDESVKNAHKIIINGSDYYVILTTRKITIFDALGDLHQERDLDFNASYSYIGDLDYDGNDELVVKYALKEGVSRLEIFDSNLQVIGNITYNPLVFSFQGFVDYEGDGLKEFIFIEKGSQANLVTIHLLNWFGNEVLKYQVTEVENYDYSDFKCIEIEDSLTGENYAVLFLTFMMKTSTSYIDVYKAHILYVSGGKVILEKTYNIGPVTTLGLWPIATYDFDKNGFPEIFMIYRETYSYGIGILLKNGSLWSLGKITDYSFVDVNSFRVILKDLDGDMNKEIVFAFSNSFDEGYIVMLNAKRMTVNSFRTQITRATIIGEMGLENQYGFRLIYSLDSYIYFVSLNGSLVRSFRTPLRSIVYGYVCDLDSDGREEIILIGHAYNDELIVILSANGEIKKTLEVSFPLYYCYYARRGGRFSFLVWYKSYVDIYLDNGEILNVFNVTKNVPHILYDSQISYVDLNNDGFKELIAVDESTLYIYYLYNKSIKRISVPRGYNIKIFIADIDGDTYKDIVIYNQFFGKITGISLKRGEIFSYYFNSSLYLYDLVPMQYDNDTGEELGLLLSDNYNSYIFIIDNNGDKQIEIGLNVSDINILKFAWITYNDPIFKDLKNGFLLAYKVGGARYKFLIINVNGEIVWNYDYTSDTGIYAWWDKIYVHDFDTDGSVELILVRLSSSNMTFNSNNPLVMNVSLEYIDLPEGFLWEKVKSILGNIMGFSATVSIVNWKGKKYLGFAYSLTRVSSYRSKIIAKFQLTDLNGEKVREKTIEVTGKDRFLVGIPIFSEYNNRTYCLLIKEAFDLSGSEKIDILISEISSLGYASIKVGDIPFTEKLLIKIDNDGNGYLLGLVLFINNRRVSYLKVKK